MKKAQARTQMALLVRRSCAKHPLLKAGKKLPHKTVLTVDSRLLFSLATLRRQQPIAGMRTYDETKKAWRDLLGVYRFELEFANNDLVAKSIDSESVQDLSEIVGIGCGLAALRAQFNLNINRVRRYRGKHGKKRMDFEFFRGNKRFFHETKGTTDKYAVTGLREDIEKQKNATKSQNKNPADGRQLSGCTGSITLYRRSSESTYDSSVELLDPPSAGELVLYRESDELSTVLRYYLNFYSATHRDPQGSRLFALADWLKQVVRELESGGRPPRRAPQNIYARGRLSATKKESRYSGTLFDARATQASARRFRTFPEANRALEDPVIFVGVAEEVTAAILEGRWGDLLEFEDERTVDEQRDDQRTVLESGILVRSEESSEELERLSAAMFAQLRAIAEAEGRARG